MRNAARSRYLYTFRPLEIGGGGWAQLKDIWMRWNAICLNNQEPNQSHPMCAVLLVHTCAMCFYRKLYWQIFHCNSLMRSWNQTVFLSLQLFAVNTEHWRRLCTWGWMDVMWYDVYFEVMKVREVKECDLNTVKTSCNNHICVSSQYKIITELFMQYFFYFSCSRTSKN